MNEQDLDTLIQEALGQAEGSDDHLSWKVLRQAWQDRGY